jgi:AraC-like DNA-binding protein
MKIDNHGQGFLGGIHVDVVHYYPLHAVDHLEPQPDCDTALHVIHGAARASQLQIPSGWLSLCIPMVGDLQLESPGSDWELPARRMQVWRDSELRIGCHSSSCWLGLTGPLQIWNRHLRATLGHEANIFPCQSACPRALRRLLVRLARYTRGTAATGNPATLIEAICVVLFEQQRDLHERLRRCSGRTLQRRQQTLLRLLRVRQLIETHPDNRPNLAQLASSANYSPWHLIRMYRDVFDETPSEYASRLRLQRAWSLVRNTRLPICEITEALGFESQSSFCRAFKNAYGTTTSNVRHGHAMAIASSHALPRSDALATTRAA